MNYYIITAAEYSAAVAIQEASGFLAMGKKFEFSVKAVRKVVVASYQPVQGWKPLSLKDVERYYTNFIHMAQVS